MSIVRLVAMTLGLLVLARPAAGQWFVTGFAGNAATSPVRLSISAPGARLTIDPVELRDESAASPWYYGGRLTKKFARVRWLAVEGEFIHAKTISDANQLVRVRGELDGRALDDHRPLGSVLPRFELSHGLNFVLANVALFWPVRSSRSNPRLMLVGRIGAGPTAPHVEATFRGANEDRYQLGGAAVGGGVGAQMRLSARLDAVADFKVTRTTQRVDVGPARLTGSFSTRHAIVGLSFHTK